MRSSHKPRPAAAVLALAVFCIATGSLRADPTQTYVALGDALAFGQSSASPQPSFGDQGYVQQFATFLGTQNKGVTPNVINLALPGETSSTYFSADNSSSPSRQAGAQANLNYGGDSSLSQRAFLAGVGAAERAAGRSITTVSFSLGLGDYLSLTGTPGFSQMTLSQQEAAVGQLLTNLQGNYTTALTQIHGALPGAQLYLLNYYNPYTSLGPNDPKNVLFSMFAAGQNSLIQSLAPQYGAKLVDLSPLGNNAANFDSSSGGFPLPTSAGYSAIANQAITAAELPEPGTLSLLACGAAGLAGCGWFRRRAG